MFEEIIDSISKFAIIPVIALEDVKDVKSLGTALCEGGLPCAEITFRTKAASEVIQKMAEEFPNMLIGAGTVLTIKQVDEAMGAGAKFIVSPGINPKIVAYCIGKKIPIIPGCVTPSDIEQALELGLNVVKFFPSEAAGGIKMLKAISAPYAQVRFMPTGGIGPNNLEEYLKFPNVIACGGSWMVTKELIAAEAFDKIEELTQEAVKIRQRIERNL